MPAERLPMRKIRDILRLRWGCGLSSRQIAVSHGIARSVLEHLRGGRPGALALGSGERDHIAERARENGRQRHLFLGAKRHAHPLARAASCRRFPLVRTRGPEARRTTARATTDVVPVTGILAERPPILFISVVPVPFSTAADFTKRSVLKIA